MTEAYKGFRPVRCGAQLQWVNFLVQKNLLQWFRIERRKVHIGAATLRQRRHEHEKFSYAELTKCGAYVQSHDDDDGGGGFWWQVTRTDW